MSCVGWVLDNLLHKGELLIRIQNNDKYPELLQAEALRRVHLNVRNLGQLKEVKKSG